MTTQTTDGQPSTRASRRGGGGGPTAPFGPTGDRLPVPARQRRPALAALAVVLILGGAALAATLVLTSGQKQQYLLINRDIAVGQTLTADDFLQQPLSATNSTVFAPVPVTDFAARVRGRKALFALRKGALLTDGMFGDQLSPPRGMGDLALNVPEGQFPAGLAPGDIVKVIYTPRKSEGASAGTSRTGSTGTASGLQLVTGATLIANARVTSVRPNSAGQGGDVIDIQINDEDLPKVTKNGMPAVAVANASGDISVVRLDPEHDYDKGADQ